MTETTKQKNGAQKSSRAAKHPHLFPSAPAQIALYDSPSATPEIIEVLPQDPKLYLDEITKKVIDALRSYNSPIPFMVIRECVENLIHASFLHPVISILFQGKLVRFSDQGPGIAQKEQALQYGTTTATKEMKHYIRGVGSGLPIASQYMHDKGGSLSLEDNLGQGCVVTLSFQKNPSFSKGNEEVDKEIALHESKKNKEIDKEIAPHESKENEEIAPHKEINVSQDTPPLDPPSLNEKEKQALLVCASRKRIGPTDLSSLLGTSLSTWTRVLQHLKTCGLLEKPARQQKYNLTFQGKEYLSRFL